MDEYIENVILSKEMLETESCRLLHDIIEPVFSLDLSPYESEVALDHLIREWMIRLFQDCPDQIDQVIEDLRIFIYEDIAEYHNESFNMLN